jgi:hypothetical protein
VLGAPERSLSWGSWVGGLCRWNTPPPTTLSSWGTSPRIIVDVGSSGSVRVGQNSSNQGGVGAVPARCSKTGNSTPREHQMAWGCMWGSSELPTRVCEQTGEVVGGVRGGGGPQRGVRSIVLEPSETPPQTHTSALPNIVFRSTPTPQASPLVPFGPTSRGQHAPTTPHSPAPHHFITPPKKATSGTQGRRVREGGKLERTPRGQESPMYG